MSGIATKCAKQLEELLKTNPAVKKVFHIYDEKELLDRSKGLPLSSKTVNVGVLYEGMKANQSVAKGGSAGTVISTEIVVSVVIMGKPDDIYGADKTGMPEHLDSIRDAVKGQRSPTNHLWRFMVEAPAVLNDDVVLWIQRWSTAANNV